ncbi:MAG: hypothetical protein K2X77_02690 [Candidatus Obscuribacterales bacterium]|nr:hypothetical protein [Candidatus Obscuribacterales bacterium]
MNFTINSSQSILRVAHLRNPHSERMEGKVLYKFLRTLSCITVLSDLTIQRTARIEADFHAPPLMREIYVNYASMLGTC